MDLDGEGLTTVREGSKGSRKRQKSVNAREKLKEKRHSAPLGSNVFVGCKHKNTRFSCCKIRPPDALHIRELLFSSKNKVIQDNKIAGWVHVSDVKQRRKRYVQEGSKAKPHTLQVKYTVPSKVGQTVHVCKKFFMHLTCLKNNRLNNICKLVKTGKDIKERRGGDRISNKSKAKKESVREFIGDLKGSESHYNRKKSARIYLHSDLTQNKLRKIYNSKVPPELQVSRSMFQRIFSEFNVGFQSPASDTCSYCTRLTFQIRNEINPVKRSEFMLQKRIHKLRAKAFYDLLRTDDDEKTTTLCFDLQQVHPLPKTAIQQAYYARQIGFYNLCCVDPATKKPFFYCWTEDQAGRGSLEISSALLDFLEKNINEEGKENVRFFSDGCGGQNKNNIVLHALMNFFEKKSRTTTIKNMTLYFPVRGHTFLPADRVFGRVERELKKHVTIQSKEEYLNFYRMFGTVRVLGQDWFIKDTKSLATVYKNLPNISSFKRIEICKQNTDRPNKTRIVVNGQTFLRFNEEVTAVTLLKRGFSSKKASEIILQDVPLEHSISEPKKKDVDSLLKELFGEAWRECEAFPQRQWYVNIIDSQSVTDPTTSCEEEQCDCLEDDEGVHI